jgi:ketosteroid isomerase-like protein
MAGEVTLQDTTIRDWFENWRRLIVDVDYENARNMFAGDVVGFGTYMRLVRGIDELEGEQWRSIWGRITDFEFDLDSMVTGTSDDQLTGWGLSLWTSMGYTDDGAGYERPGRATVLLTRPGVDHPWKAIHTHLSLVPGTPLRTFGPPQDR